MSETTEPDCVAGARHPRETTVLFGQSKAEQSFLDAEAAGRLHHAWLLTGPRGIGKATLAWRIARYLLAGSGTRGLPSLLPETGPPLSLDMDSDHPVFRRCAALSEPRLALIRRGRDERTERLRSEITVNEVRTLRATLQLSAADGGWRMVIIDPADALNSAAANALLKFLEEPPARVLFALVSHQPARLLPTIRSRCRVLRLSPLAPEPLSRALAAAITTDEARPDPGDAIALAELSGGSVGEALQLSAGEGVALYAEIVALLASLPAIDRSALNSFTGSLAGRGTETRRELAERLVERALARLARGVAVPGSLTEAAPGETALIARYAGLPGAAQAWADTAQTLSARMAQGMAVNLDPGQVMLDTFLQIEETARRLPSAAA